MKIERVVVAVESALHGVRIWRRISSRNHITRKGRCVAMVIWETPCIICGAPFRITVPKFATQGENFDATTCPAHRLLPSEAGKLHGIDPEVVRAAFEALKQRMLAESIS